MIKSGAVPAGAGGAFARIAGRAMNSETRANIEAIQRELGVEKIDWEGKVCAREKAAEAGARDNAVLVCVPHGGGLKVGNHPRPPGGA